MEKFTSHTGIPVPLRRSNVDTDQIIPAVYLKRITRSGFEGWHHLPTLSPPENHRFSQIPSKDQPSPGLPNPGMVGCSHSRPRCRQ